MTAQARLGRSNGTSVRGYPRRTAKAGGACPGLEKVHERRIGRFREKLGMLAKGGVVLLDSSSGPLSSVKLVKLL